MTGLNYREFWPGYSLAESDFNFHSSERTLRLIAQKESAAGRKNMYKPFLTTSDKDSGELLSKVFSKRRTIEEFFNFEGDMGWNRASTFNLNIR